MYKKKLYWQIHIKINIFKKYLILLYIYAQFIYYKINNFFFKI